MLVLQIRDILPWNKGKIGPFLLLALLVKYIMTQLDILKWHCNSPDLAIISINIMHACRKPQTYLLTWSHLFWYLGSQSLQWYQAYVWCLNILARQSVVVFFFLMHLIIYITSRVDQNAIYSGLWIYLFISLYTFSLHFSLF